MHDPFRPRRVSALAALLASLILMAAMPEPAYCTPVDVIDEYGVQFVAEKAGEPTGTFDLEDAEDPVTIRVQRCIDAFAAEMNSAIRARYQDTPFDGVTNGDSSEVVPFLRSLNVEGAMLVLWRRHPNGLDESAREDQKRLDRMLLQIAEGTLDLGAPPGEAEEPISGVTFRGSTRLFGRATTDVTS